MLPATINHSVILTETPRNSEVRITKAGEDGKAVVAHEPFDFEAKSFQKVFRRF